jgi:hypothetical protein
MEKLSFFTIVLLIATTGCSYTPAKENKKIKNDSTVFELVKEHQVLLTNSAEFIDHSGLNGASAFLVKYQNKVYAVTAKHLIGEAGGVEPEIKVNELTKYLRSWKMFPRVSIRPESDSISIGKPKLNYDSLNTDILILEVANSNYNILPLQTNFTLPVEGDNLYIIGCPYSQENCKQNIYEVKYDSYHPETGMLISISKHKVEMAGFSGAPLVNAQGDVVGAVTSGWEENNMFYVGATFIKEIQKVK